MSMKPQDIRRAWAEHMSDESTWLVGLWRRARGGDPEAMLLPFHQQGTDRTGLGLGLSLAYAGKDVSKLLGPLAFKCWTTVAGLAFSNVLTSLFGMKLPAWVDACEKNMEAWDARRRGVDPSPRSERPPR